MEHARTAAKLPVKETAKVVVWVVMVVARADVKWELSSDKSNNVVTNGFHASQRIFINLIMFSKEWIFQECNLHNHCLGLRLASPIMIEGKLYEKIFVLKVLATVDEQEMLLRNRANYVNSNSGAIKVLGFKEGESPNDAKEVLIEVSNIIDVLKIGS